MNLKPSSPIVIIAGIAFVGIFIWMSSISRSSSTSQDSKRPSVGDSISLQYDSTHDVVYLTTTKEEYSELTKYALAKDITGIVQMKNRGSLIIVKPGTRALMIDYDSFAGTLYEVRILEGNSEGEKGFVLRKAAHKI
jgi:hypothetical protein